MQLLCPVKGRLLFILLGRSLPVAHHFGKSCHYQLHHCAVSRQPAMPASVGPRGHCVHWASACAVSDCGVVSTGVVGPHCFITHCFPSFFIYSICRTVFWLFLPIICVQDFIYDFHFRIEKGHFKIYLCEGGNSQCLLSHQTECNLLPKQHSEKEGPSLHVISIQGASCKKQPGLPTAISLDSPTQESRLLKAEPFAFLEQGDIQHHHSRPAQFSTLRVWVQALYAPVVVDHPAHPERVCNLKSQGQGSQILASSFPGGSLKALCKFTYPSLSFPYYFRFWLSIQLTAETSLDIPWKPLTITCMHILSWCQMKHYNRQVGQELPPYPEEEREALEEDRCFLQDTEPVSSRA